MSLRLAVWYPHGRAGLPLAARLFSEQLKGSQVVWASGEPVPATPGIGEADLWLVFCATTPPEPPPWRHAVAGVWAVFPGTAADWTVASDAALEVWQPCRTLTDLLPDETGNRFLRQRWRAGDVAWFPAWHNTSTQRKPGRGLFFETSAGLPDLLSIDALKAFAEGLFAMAQPGVAGSPAADTRINERLLLCSADPVFSGVAVRDAASRGTPVIVLGTPGSAMRRRLQGGGQVRVISWPGPGGRIRPMFDALKEAIREARTVARCEVPTLSLSDWANTLLDPARTPVDNGGVAAQLAASARFLDSDPRHVRLAELALKLVPSHGLDVFPAAALNESVFARLAQCEPTHELSALVFLLAELVPEWAEAAGRWGAENGSAMIGDLLWTGVCDQYRTARTRVALAAAAAVYTAVGVRAPDDLRWLPDRVVLAAVTGDILAATAALERLRQLNRAGVVPAMLAILRAWLPGLESGEEGVVPSDGPAWWKKQIDQCVADGLPSAGSIRAYAYLWMDSPEVAAELFARVAPSRMETASFVILAWLCRAPGLAGRVWAPHAAMPLPEDRATRLTVLCAKALCESPQPALLFEKRRMDETAPGIYDRTFPSHYHCFFSALIHHRWGDVSEAAKWRVRAEADDLMASRRAWCFESLPNVGSSAP